MTPIQRAAIALCELDGNIPNATLAGKPLWKDYLPEVRAALQAMREPSEGMIAVIADVAPIDSVPGDWDYPEKLAVAQWQAMIDAAMKEG